MFATEVITQAALDTLLWVSTVYDYIDPAEGIGIEGGVQPDDVPADEVFSTYDFPAEDVAAMHATVTGFLDGLAPSTTRYLLDNVTAEQIGHDFVLTAQHHGAGFWDRGHPQAVSDDLTAWAHTFSIEFEAAVEHGRLVPHVR